MSSLRKVYSALSDQPLFLPKGSIRAIIAITVVVTWVVLLANQVEVSKEFYVVLGAVVTFYFQARENDRERALEAKKSGDVLAAIQALKKGGNPGRFSRN